MRIFFTLLWLLATLVAAGLTITCYDCDSINDKYCGDAFFPENIAQTDCDSLEVPDHLRLYYPQRRATACVTKYYEGMPGEKYFVRRSCYVGDVDDTAFSCGEHPDPVAPYLNFLGCLPCEDDLCNASTSMRSSWTISLAAVVLLLVIVI